MTTFEELERVLCPSCPCIPLAPLGITYGKADKHRHSPHPYVSHARPRPKTVQASGVGAFFWLVTQMS